jgi:hypothetical protein
MEEATFGQARSTGLAHIPDMRGHGGKASRVED